MMLLSFLGTIHIILGTIHIKLILFPRSQILKRTAAHMNTQIHIHYPNQRWDPLEPDRQKTSRAISNSAITKSLSCYKPIKAVSTFRM